LFLTRDRFLDEARRKEWSIISETMLTYHQVSLSSFPSQPFHRQSNTSEMLCHSGAFETVSSIILHDHHNAASYGGRTDADPPIHFSAQSQQQSKEQNAMA
jgi:hypothetical protein